MGKTIKDSEIKLTRRIFNKILRIVEGPPVRDRIVVKTVDSSRSTPSRPCFIIGVYRSGTTLLRFILDSHSNIAVPPETNFIHSLSQMYDCEWTNRGLRGVGVDRDQLAVRLREFSLGIFNDYAAAKGKKRWIDKTPSYVDLLEFLDLLYGEDCQYILLFRNGLDVADSMARMYESSDLGGPVKDLPESKNEPPKTAYAKYWAGQCEKMIKFEEKRNDRCFRMLYEDFATDPETYLPPVFKFLNEPWEPDVLNFYKIKHDFGLQDSIVMEKKGFKPNIGRFKQWDDSEIIEIQGEIGDTLKKLGYMNDKSIEF